MSDDTLPRWEAVDSEDKVVGVWIERGGAYGPDWVRQCRDEHYPGTRLRVTTWTSETRWDDAQ